MAFLDLLESFIGPCVFYPEKGKIENTNSNAYEMNIGDVSPLFARVGEGWAFHNLLKALKLFLLQSVFEAYNI